MSKALSLKWTKGLDESDKERTEKLIRNSGIVLSRLRDIIQEDLDNIQKETEKDYDNPSWAYLQAHKNGKSDYARQMLSLLNFLK